jgi:hypothetical protein
MGEVHKGAAELNGLPAEILLEFSKRRLEMLRAAEFGGISLDTKAGGEAAALATRDRKEYGSCSSMGANASRTACPSKKPCFTGLVTMRMRGLEPPQSYLHTDLNRIRAL